MCCNLCLVTHTRVVFVSKNKLDLLAIVGDNYSYTFQLHENASLFNKASLLNEFPKFIPSLLNNSKLYYVKYNGQTNK